ncbi:nucleoside triphosphate pyrophosphohydrolase [Bacillus solimangrovi]|uniref:Nucleoside triphosphate pyrophosphohydrolase n=1 Tax=Bacillus solimangrovi TaxID=1305675 RepID=A0A1E5LEX8_9BACI|nr:nucleoside triphosphate pyrophosphohydrolase [Bacillus solimangrovi]OEH92638.1 nucleoside triphosphate pyrophosphohydrolase [Bacillus solimangrovi]
MKNNIVVIGLGFGELENMSIGIYRCLKQASHLFVRTIDHPAVQEIEAEGVKLTSFDHIYEKYDQFEDVYAEIIQVLISESKHKEIVYAVPGHPLTAEKTVQLLLEREQAGEIMIRIVGGQSFLDAMFTSLRIDPIEGFQMVDATDLSSNQLQLKQHLIICQVYDALTASNVKLTLMEKLPDDYEVIIATAAGTENEIIKKVPLFELDRETTINNLTSVYVPPVTDETLLYHEFSTLKEVISILRGPDGCPWDRKQTHESLKKYLVEETYEVLDAIDEKDDDSLAEELGDVLLQVMLHAQIGEDEGYFSIHDVIYHLTDKMIRRHPHVFGDMSVADADEVVSNWEQIKKSEHAKNEQQSLLSGIPSHLPSLYRAYELQKKAAKVGFDWKEVTPIWEKVEEELSEFKEAVHTGNAGEVEGEFGDIIFALVNIARFYKIDPEEALRATNRKFQQRFEYIERVVNERELTWAQLSLEEMDEIWEEAKKFFLNKEQ